MKKCCKFAINAICVVCWMLLLWVIISYFDVVAHNCSPDPVFASWNLFALLF